MTMKSLILAVAAAFSMSLLSVASPAKAFSGGTFPSCDAPQVLNYIQNRFVWTDRHVIKRGLAIDSISQNPSQTAWSMATSTGPSRGSICRGTAHMNDGKQRTIWWLIEGGMGFAGLRDNLEFCISGLDPFKVHGAWCRSVR